MDEADILENAFQIIFAFDEIVALGYRESVNLAQIRTFVEMDSHEEKVYQVSTIYPKELDRWWKYPLFWEGVTLVTSYWLFLLPQAVRQTQEREAKQKMREKAKELQRQKMEAQKRGAKGGPSISSSSSYGGSGGFASGPSVGDTLSTPAEPPKPTFNSSM